MFWRLDSFQLRSGRGGRAINFQYVKVFVELGVRICPIQQLDRTVSIRIVMIIGLDWLTSPHQNICRLRARCSLTGTLINTPNGRERDHSGDLDVDGWIIFGWIRGMWVYGLDWAGPG